MLALFYVAGCLLFFSQQARQPRQAAKQPVPPSSEKTQAPHAARAASFGFLLQAASTTLSDGSGCLGLIHSAGVVL